MKDDKIKRIVEGLLSINIGTIVSFYFLEITQSQLLPLSMKIQEMVANREITEIQIYRNYLLLLGNISLLTVPLFIFIKWNKNTGYKILAILFFVFADMGAVVSVVVSGKIFPMFILLMWGTSVFLVWLCIDIINMMVGNKS